MAPAEGLPPATRQALFEDALRLTAEAKYLCAGTVEFLVDSEGRYVPHCDDDWLYHFITESSNGNLFYFILFQALLHRGGCVCLCGSFGRIWSGLVWMDGCAACCVWWMSAWSGMDMHGLILFIYGD